MALGLFSDMTDVLVQDKEISEGNNPESVEEITIGLVQATGNLIQAIMKSDKKYNESFNAVADDVDNTQTVKVVVFICTFVK